MSSEPAQTAQLRRRAADLAQDLVSDCSVLQESLAQLRNVPPDQMEQSIERHLSQVQPVCRRIEAAAGALRQLQQSLQRAGGGPGRQVEADLGDCRRLLSEASETYGELAAAMDEMMGGIRRRLATLRRGGKTLRSYRRGTELAG